MKSIVLVLSLMGILGCGEPPKNYQIQKNDSPLSSRDIESAFAVLGLRIERFSSMIPSDCRIGFSIKEYINGIEQGGTSSGTVSTTKGLKQFALFIEDDGEDLTYHFEGVGLASGSIKGYSAKTWGWFETKEIKKGQAVPVYYYAASHGGIEGAGSVKSVDEIQSKYDFLSVFFMEVL